MPFKPRRSRVRRGNHNPICLPKLSHERILHDNGGGQGHSVPVEMRSLFEHLCNSSSRFLRIEVPILAPSLNDYKKPRRGGGWYIVKEVAEFRRWVALRTLSQRANFSGWGAVAALIEFHSPKWLTLKETPRNIDVDNLIKQTLDGIQQEASSGFNDCTVWQVHGFKVSSPSPKTVIWLFDLGNRVNYYEGR